MATSDLDSVNMKINLAKEFSKGWHNNIQHWRNLYNFKHYDVLPQSGEIQYQDPTYTNTVDLAVGIVLANTIIWKATPWTASPDSIPRASQIEKYLAGLISINSDHNEYDTIYELLLNFARDGGACLYSVWDDKLADQVLEERELYDSESGMAARYKCYTEVPVLMHVIDPLSINMLPGSSRRWSVMARIEKASVYDVYDRFKVIPNSRKHLEGNLALMLNEFGDLIDYWEYAFEDEKQVVKHAILFDNEFIEPLTTMKKYDELPYTVAFYKPTSRTDSGKWKNIMDPMISSISMLERAINRRQRQIDIYSSLSIVTKTAHGRAIKVDPALGDAINLDTTEDIGFPQWPGNAPDVDKQIEMFRGRSQQSGFTDLFYGSSASDSGFALSQQTDQNRIRLTQPITHFERLLSWWAKKAIQITIGNAEPDSKIFVYGKVKDHEFLDAISVSDLEGSHIVCKVQPEFPNEKVRKHAMANQVRGLLPDTTIIEDYLNYQQPDEQIDRAQIEAAMKTPVVLNYMAVAKLTELANAGDQVAELVLSALQNGTLPGEVGRPKEPSNIVQGEGIQTVPNRDAGQTAPNLQGGV